MPLFGTRFPVIALLIIMAMSILPILPISFSNLVSPSFGQSQIQDRYPLNGPRIDQLIFKYYASPDAEIAALQRGEIEEVSDLIRPTDIRTLSRDPNINLTFSKQTHYCYVAFNLRKDTIDQVSLRKAIAHLIPREQISNQLFQGLVTEPMLYEVSPAFGKWHNPNVQTYPFDVDKAKQILATAGYKQDSDGKCQDPAGKPLRELSFLSPTQEEAPTSYEIAQIITDSIRSIGIPVRHEPISFDALLTRVYTDHNFDMYFLCNSNLGNYPRWLYDFYHSSLDIPDGDNSPGVHNSELDRLLTRFRFEDKTEEEALADIWRAQEIIADLVARTPIYSRYEVEATRKGWTDQVETRGSGFFSPGAWAWFTVHREGQPLGGTFTASVGGRVRTLSPMFDTGAYDQKIWNLIYEGLISSNPEGETIPALADKWMISDIDLPDGTPGRTITYHLLQNATWQDGTKFTSKDVKFTYDFIAQQRIPMWLPAVQNIVDVKAIDDGTVVITLKSRGFFTFLDVSGVVILPQHLWFGVGGNWRTFVPSQEKHPSASELTKEIGTGPFILTEFKSGEYWRLTWNPQYHKRYPDKMQTGSTNISLPVNTTLPLISLTAAITMAAAAAFVLIRRRRQPKP